MDVFRRLFFVALFAGVLSGSVVTVAHQFGTVPIILEAEVYEKSAEAHGHPGVSHEHAHHDPAVMEKMAAAEDAHEHDHGAEA